MTTTTPARLHHLALTVTDVDSSIRWYEGVFGIRHQVDVPHEGGVGKLLADADRSLMIVLHRHDANAGEVFDERVAGLDHAGFVVPSRADLEGWQTHLEAHGVGRVGSDEPYGSVLVVRDPDNIQLELFSPPAG